MGLRAPVVAPRPRSSSASSRTKRIPVGATPDEDTDADAAADEDQGHSAQVRGPRLGGYQNNAWRGRRRWRRRRCSHPCHPAERGRSSSRQQGEASLAPSTTNSPAPSPGGKGSQAASKRVAGGGRKNARAKCWRRLNSCAWTWIYVTQWPGCSKPQPTGQPARRIKKLQPKGCISVRT